MSTIVGVEFSAMPAVPMAYPGIAEGGMVILSVCVRDGIGKYAVYSAISRDPIHFSQSQLDQQVNWTANLGQKQRYQEAVRYFPSLVVKEYRA